jgi:hypothetical protein
MKCSDICPFIWRDGTCVIRTPFLCAWWLEWDFWRLPDWYFAQGEKNVTTCTGIRCDTISVIHLYNRTDSLGEPGQFKPEFNRCRVAFRMVFYKCPPPVHGS